MALYRSANQPAEGVWAKVEANLRQVLGVPLEFFAALVTGEDVVHRKPHPDIFLEAASRLRMPAISCCVVEDAVHGVQAARAAGMRCVAITTSFPREALVAAGAGLVCDSISEISLDDLLVG